MPRIRRTLAESGLPKAFVGAPRDRHPRLRLQPRLRHLPSVAAEKHAHREENARWLHLRPRCGTWLLARSWPNALGFIDASRPHGHRARAALDDPIES